MKHETIVRRNRTARQLRTMSVAYNIFEYAAGSTLFQMGNTKILCAVTIQTGVPPFLRGKGSGWLTAEYSMLPAATTMRTARESVTNKRNGRSVEISRLIGRVLRTVVDLKALPDSTVTVDCDVLQADGGTRTASINAACLALRQAQELWLSNGFIQRPFLKEGIAAVAVGVIGDQIVLDPDYQEDSDGNADFNIIMTESGNIIEVQGGAEKEAVSWNTFEQAGLLAREGIKELFIFFEAHQSTISPNLPEGQERKSIAIRDKQPQKAALFSLQNRIRGLQENQS